MHRKLTIAVLLAASTYTLAGQAYTFTKVADNALGSQFNALGAPFAMNNRGDVAFKAQVGGIQGVYLWSSGTITKVVESGPLGTPTVAGLNDSGVVLVEMEDSNDIYVASNGSLTKVFDVASVRATAPDLVEPSEFCGFPSINNSGLVVISTCYRILGRTGTGPIQTLVSETELPRLAPSAAPFITSPFVNNSGGVAFLCTSCTFIYKKDSAGLVKIARYGSSSAPVILDSGQVVFAYYQVPPGVYSSDGISNGGVPTVLADLSARLGTPDGLVSANNNGQFVFGYTGVSNTIPLKGLYTSANIPTDRVIATGDSMFGLTVTTLTDNVNTLSSANGINDQGQVVFAYSQTDPKSGNVFGIAVATPSANSTIPSVSQALDGAALTANLAQGSMFVVKGTGLSAPGTVQATAPNYPATLNNVSMTLTPANGGAPIKMMMVYTYNFIGDTTVAAAARINQLAAVVPSSVPVGAYDLKITNGTTTSATYRTNVVARKPGIVSASGDGTGIAQATLQGGLILQRSSVQGKIGLFDTRPAHPGDIMTIWGTGLGPDLASDAGSSSGDQTAAGQIRVVLDGTDIIPSYAGRSSGYPGLDQINFTIPSTIKLSCSNSIQVRAGGVLSNLLTIASSAPTATSCPQ